MIESDFLPKDYSDLPFNGNVTWESPSNIALIKYWGKYGEQLPANSSLSFTLSNCKTKTVLKYQLKKEASKSFDFEIFLDDKPAPDFKPKVELFFKRVEPYLPFLKAFNFEIATTNTFPHSSGIASSASGMSALACCLIDLEKKISNEENSDEYWIQKSSFIARLGSGSACRSLEGNIVVWGDHSKIENSSNLFGVKYEGEVHENFKNYQDTILLVDKGEKQVSSSVGHNLMHQHPFATKRFEQANENITRLVPVLKRGNLSKFIEIVESEALTLHAMMMTSLPYFILIKPNTLEIINKIWEYRRKLNSNVCFTLDAGANLHLLYPENEKDLILEFIKNELVAYCQNGQYICDQVGIGAKKM